MVRRSKEEAEKTRAVILREAKKLFQRKGFSETSVAEICDKAKITKGGLFHYFPNKENLFREVWTRLQIQMDMAAREAAIAARSKTDHYAAFLAGIETYLDWATRPDYQQIVLIDGPSVLGMSGWYEADDHLGRDNTMAGMRYLASQGLVAPDMIVPLAVLFHNALNGAGFAISRGGEGVTKENAMQAFETMLKAMGKPGG